MRDTSSVGTRHPYGCAVAAVGSRNGRAHDTVVVVTGHYNYRAAGHVGGGGVQPGRHEVDAGVDPPAGAVGYQSDDLMTTAVAAIARRHGAVGK